MNKVKLPLTAGHFKISGLEFSTAVEDGKRIIRSNVAEEGIIYLLYYVTPGVGYKCPRRNSASIIFIDGVAFHDISDGTDI